MHFRLFQNSLKFIACISMVIDHIGYVFFPNAAIFRIIGRLAFPLFAYFIYEGCCYTKNIRHYFLRVFSLGVICFLAYLIFSKEIYGNVLLTFSCSILIIWSLQVLTVSVMQNNPMLLNILAVLGNILLLIVSDRFLHLDYGIPGALLPVITYLCSLINVKNKYFLSKPDNHKKNSFPALAGFCLGLLWLSAVREPIQYFGFFSVPLLICYSGERQQNRFPWLFYIFYPVHLVVIEGIFLLSQELF